MNNKYVRPLLTALLPIVLFAGLSYLYIETRAIGLSGQIDIRHDLRAIESLDAEWNLNVWREKNGYQKKYTTPSGEIINLGLRLNTELLPLRSVTLTETASSLNKMLEKKRLLVASFDAQVAILNDTLDAMPIAASVFDETIKKRYFTGKNQPPSLPAILALKEMVDTLMSNTLKFHLSPSNEAAASVEEFAGYIESAQEIYPKDITAQSSILIAQARTITSHQVLLDGLLGAINGMNASRYTGQMDETLSRDYELQKDKKNLFEKSLFAYAALMVLMIAYSGYKIAKTLRSVREINETLETKVASRTQELRDALDNLRESQVQLVQAEKMAMLGQMVAGVTHEINTPLGYVKSGLEISRDRVAEFSSLIFEITALTTLIESDDASEESIGTLVHRISTMAREFSSSDMINEMDGLLKDGLYGIEQISEIVVSLKNFSRMDRSKIAEFNIHDGLNSTLKMATNLVKNKIIVKKYGEVKPITCMPSAINQVFLNLIANAAQATEGNDHSNAGEIRIITSMEDRMAKVEIVDNGPGMTDDVMKKIFDPFFTTKKVGEGTGIGLSICQRIVKEHGGTISVQSKVGIGTRFVVLLPEDAHDKLAMTGQYKAQHA